MRAVNKAGDISALDAAAERLARLLRQGHRLAAVPGRDRLRAHLSVDRTPLRRALPGRQLGRAGSTASCASATPARKTISANGGSPAVDTTFDPVERPAANPAPTASGDDLPGVATYRLPAAAGSGYTLMGSPTVVATISSPVANSEIAARLLDVDADGTETLVDRQLYRPQVGTSRQVFQLHPSGHLFAPGHVAKLELLPKDAGGADARTATGAPANGQGDITVSNLDLRLPVLEAPGAAGGQVEAAPPPAASLRHGDRAPVLLGLLRPRHARRRQAQVQGQEGGKVPVDSAPGVEPVPGPDQAAGLGQGRSGRSRQEEEEEGRSLGQGDGDDRRAARARLVKVKLTKHGAQAVLRRSRISGRGDHGGLGRQHRADRARSKVGKKKAQEAQEASPLLAPRVSRRAPGQY